MKIGIIGAMEEEIRYLKEVIQNQEVQNFYGYEFTSGSLGAHDIVLVLSGIGKVNATVSTVLLKEKFEVEAMINTGSAGAIDSALKVGDVVIAHSLVHHDVDVTGFGYEPGQMAGMPKVYYPNSELLRIAQAACREIDIEPIVGQIASGDQFINSKEKINEISTTFPTVRAAEMESAAIAQSAYVLGVPFVIIRAISDSADSEASISFDQFILFAGKMSASLVTKFIEAIPADLKL